MHVNIQIWAIPRGQNAIQRSVWVDRQRGREAGVTHIVAELIGAVLGSPNFKKSTK